MTVIVCSDSVISRVDFDDFIKKNVEVFLIKNYFDFFLYKFIIKFLDRTYFQKLSSCANMVPPDRQCWGSTLADLPIVSGDEF